MPEYNPPADAHYCEVDVVELIDKEVFKMMGNGGSYFKTVTEQCKAKYIWWNKEKKVIEVWGSYGCMQKVYNRLIKKKNEIISKRKTEDYENEKKRERETEMETSLKKPKNV